MNYLGHTRVTARSVFRNGFVFDNDRCLHCGMLRIIVDQAIVVHMQIGNKILNKLVIKLQANNAQL